MTTSYVWVVLLVLTIICILSSVPRKSNIEHFTFDEVLDKKCSDAPGDKHDYKWGGGTCIKSFDQCDQVKVKCLNLNPNEQIKSQVQDSEGGCRDPVGCRTTACNPRNCYDIRCDVNTGWCSQTSVANVYVAGKCKESSQSCKPSHNPCSENPRDKWKIVEGKWKKYETKMNYNADGTCVRKYLDGATGIWGIVNDDFKDIHSQCTVGNITPLRDNTQFKKVNGDILCANNPSLKWSVVTDHYNDTDEFNNRLGLEEGGVVIDLYHNSDNTCTLNNVEYDTYASYCVPSGPVQLDSYSEISNCYTEDGNQLSVKDGDSENKYIQQTDLTFTLYNGECYHKCPEIKSPERNVIKAASFHTDKCSTIGEMATYATNSCKSYCSANNSFARRPGSMCVCSEFDWIDVENSNCYKVPNHSYVALSKIGQSLACRHPNDDRLFILNNSDLLDEPICTEQEVKCFGWPNDQETPGFTRVNGTNCYKLSSENAPNDIYFKPLEGKYPKRVRDPMGRYANLLHEYRYMQLSTVDHPHMDNDCESQIQNIEPTNDEDSLTEVSPTDNPSSSTEASSRDKLGALKSVVREVTKTHNSVTINVIVDTTASKYVRFFYTGRQTEVVRLDKIFGSLGLLWFDQNNNGTIRTNTTNLRSINYRVNNITDSIFDIDIVFQDLPPNRYRFQACKANLNIMDMYDIKNNIEYSEILEVNITQTVSSSPPPPPAAVEGAPVFLPGYPMVDLLTPYSFYFYLQASENCQVYYLVVVSEYENEITADTLEFWYTVPAASRKAYGDFAYAAAGSGEAFPKSVQGYFGTGRNKLCIMLENADGVRGNVHCQEFQAI